MKNNLKFYRRRNKALTKTVTELTWDGNLIGKQIEIANRQLEDPNEADNLLYKLKAIRKKKDAIKAKQLKHKEVMKKITLGVEDAKHKLEREAKKVDEAERRNAESAPKATPNQSLIDDAADYSTNTEEAEYHKHRKTLIELK